MKNSKVMKMILVGLVSAVLMLVATQTFAAGEDANFIELDINSALTTTNTATNTTTNTATNTNTSTLNATNPINNTNTTTKSSYNNTTLPKTGIEDSGAMIFIIAMFAVSAIYAYKKVRDYNNI